MGRLFNLERVARVTCDVGYLCASFRLQDLRVLEMDMMYATDRQTSDTHDCLMPPTVMAGTITQVVKRVITGIGSEFLLVGKRIFPQKVIFYAHVTP